MVYECAYHPGSGGSRLDGPRPANDGSIREETMRPIRDEYDFSKARRGSVVPVPPGKTRITIRLDNDLLAWFRRSVHRAGGGSYQTLINQALREHVERRPETLEQTLRRVLREELPKATRTKR